MQMIFVVSADLKQVQKASPQHFWDLQIWERQHIEEWVRTTPEVLGEELLIVSAEFNRFDKSQDRLDLLAVDRLGNLVVIELKRDPFAGYADLQAIRYAAMVSPMTIDKLLPHYIDYRKKYYADEELSIEQAREQIFEFIKSEDFEELTSRPRIILCSEGFSPELTPETVASAWFAPALTHLHEVRDALDGVKPSATLVDEYDASLTKTWRRLVGHDAEVSSA